MTAVTSVLTSAETEPVVAGSQVYDALGYTWDSATTGSVSAEVDTDVAAVMAAVRGAFEARHDLTDGPLGPATLDAAAAGEADPPPRR